MSKTYHILIVDDHPLISEAYKSALKYVGQEDDINFSIDIAQDCDIAQELIQNAVDAKRSFDIVFLDIKLPPSKDGKILSGEDLGLKLNKLMPDTKIIVSTTFNDNYRIHSILKVSTPMVFWSKMTSLPKN